MPNGNLGTKRFRKRQWLWIVPAAALLIAAAALGAVNALKAPEPTAAEPAENELPSMPEDMQSENEKPENKQPENEQSGNEQPGSDPNAIESVVLRRAERNLGSDSRPYLWSELPLSPADREEAAKWIRFLPLLSYREAVDEIPADALAELEVRRVTGEEIRIYYDLKDLYVTQSGGPDGDSGQYRIIFEDLRKFIAEKLVSPVFEKDGRLVQGEAGRLAVAKVGLTAGEAEYVTWLIWRVEEIKSQIDRQTTFSARGKNLQTGEIVPVLTEWEIPVDGGILRGGAATVVTELFIPEPGIWRLEAYFGNSPAGSVTVKAVRSPAWPAIEVTAENGRTYRLRGNAEAAMGRGFGNLPAFTADPESEYAVTEIRGTYVKIKPVSGAASAEGEAAEGWVPAWYLLLHEDDAPFELPAEPYLMIVADPAAVRAYPGDPRAFGSRLEPGKVVRVTGKYEDWLRVDFITYDSPYGGDAWVPAAVLAPYDPALAREGYLREGAAVYEESGAVKDGTTNPVMIAPEPEADGRYRIDSIGGYTGLIDKDDFVPNPFAARN